MKYKELFLLKQIKARRLERQKKELVRQSDIVHSLVEELEQAHFEEEKTQAAWRDVRAVRLKSLLSTKKLLPEIESEYRVELKWKKSWLDQIQHTKQTHELLQAAESKRAADFQRVNLLLKESEKFESLCSTVMKSELRRELKRSEG
ncbi:hypothetical protein [Limnobacter alexandrii]|jgi:hypothetical protein|uniref:hypothetical protein n=1 Tax=Limnobacter alexandrii TaxID=2570352 RepID=UPI00110A00CB|nr:hypothetical protein [Limnobacter alexandrii]